MTGSDNREQFVKREPRAELRQLARLMRELYVALVDEGFSEREANALVAETLRATVDQSQ